MFVKLAKQLQHFQIMSYPMCKYSYAQIKNVLVIPFWIIPEREVNRGSGQEIIGLLLSGSTKYLSIFIYLDI